jgi:large subunit ribosomal protein L24
MKLKREDKVIVILGRDKGKTGTIQAVLPRENKVVVEGVNIIKRHTKPSQKQPRGGILEITKPIDVSKVMVLDPASGKPARVGYEIKPDGSKERVFKVSPHHEHRAKKAEKADKPKTEKKAGKQDKADQTKREAGKK